MTLNDAAKAIADKAFVSAVLFYQNNGMNYSVTLRGRLERARPPFESLYQMRDTAGNWRPIHDDDYGEIVKPYGTVLVELENCTR